MSLYDYIVKAIKELDQANEERKPVEEHDFVKTYDEGYLDGVDDTLHDLREYLRQFKKLDGEKEECVCCAGSGYYDDLDENGNNVECSACDGTGIEQDD